MAHLHQRIHTLNLPTDELTALDVVLAYSLSPGGPWESAYEPDEAADIYKRACMAHDKIMKITGAL